MAFTMDWIMFGSVILVFVIAEKINKQLNVPRKIDFPTPVKYYGNCIYQYLRRHSKTHLGHTVAVSRKVLHWRLSRGVWNRKRSSKRRGQQRFNNGVTLYRKMPLKAMSRAWGKVNDLNLPVWMRRPVYRLYIWCFDCKLEEAAIEDLRYYKNLGEFFKREIKPQVRPIDYSQSLVSPSDGKILYFGKVENNYLEQVKGVTYSLEGFLGPNSWEHVFKSKYSISNSNISLNNNRETDQERPVVLKSENSSSKECDNKIASSYQFGIKRNPENVLYHCVVYLAPGDYHRFHSPADWKVRFRRHFPGELFSVNPGIARWIQGLFSFNERAVYFGEWKHGFFSMAAVGATNVGSIKVYCDRDLVTNCGRKWPSGTFFDKEFNPTDPGVTLSKGNRFGEFNLGSTLVLVFEAPKSFRFNIQPGQKVKFGQSLGDSNFESKD